MKRFVMGAVLILFLCTFFLINWYVLDRFALLFGGARPWIPWLALALTYAYFFAAFLEMGVGNRLTSRLYLMTTLWIGGVWTILPALILADALSAVPRGHPLGAAPYAFALFIGLWLVLYAYANGHRFEVLRRVLVSPKVKRPLRIAHLSDLHIGPSHRAGYLQRVVDTVKEERPDLVVITGDLIDQPGRLTPSLLAPFRDLTMPIFYTLGNHEHAIGVKKIKRLLRDSPLRLLEDEVVTVKGITLLGLDDSPDKHKVERTLPQLSFTTKKFTVLLYHRPDGLEAAAAHGIDLMLAGHTHAGQIWPLNYTARLRFPRLSGFYTHGGTTLYVLPGTGTWGPPMRLGSRSTIMIFDIVPKGVRVRPRPSRRVVASTPSSRLAARVTSRVTSQVTSRLARLSARRSRKSRSRKSRSARVSRSRRSSAARQRSSSRGTRSSSRAAARSPRSSSPRSSRSPRTSRSRQR